MLTSSVQFFIVPRAVSDNSRFSHVTKMIILLILTLHLTTQTIGQNIHGSECRQWSSTDRKVHDCSAEVGSSTSDRTMKLLVDEFDVFQKCFQDDEAPKTRLHATWSINASFLQDQLFLLIIHETTWYSELQDISILISPNRTVEHVGKIHFEFIYAGSQKVDGPEVKEKLSYIVTLEATSNSSETKEKNFSRSKDDRHVTIPINVCKNTTLPTTTPVPETPNWLTLLVVLCVLVGMLALVASAAIAAYKCKKQKDTDNAENLQRTQNILFLLNVDERAEVAKQTNWAATALSRASGLGRLSVKYNRWETTEIARTGIAQWMREKISWANKVIVSSTPDDLRNEATAEIFEGSFQSIINEHIGTNGIAVFIIHFQGEENYRECPFMRNDNYRKFQLEQEWSSLCRSLSASFGTEQEPLQNGSQI